MFSLNIACAELEKRDISFLFLKISSEFQFFLKQMVDNTSRIDTIIKLLAVKRVVEFLLNLRIAEIPETHFNFNPAIFLR